MRNYTSVFMTATSEVSSGVTALGADGTVTVRGEGGHLTVYASEADLRRLAAACVSAADDLHDIRAYGEVAP